MSATGRPDGNDHTGRPSPRGIPRTHQSWWIGAIGCLAAVALFILVATLIVWWTQSGIFAPHIGPPAPEPPPSPPVREGRAPGAAATEPAAARGVVALMPFTRYDLRNAEERIAEVATIIERQRARLSSLREPSADAVWIEQLLAAMERTLQTFREHKRRIEAELEGVEQSGQG